MSDKKSQEKRGGLQLLLLRKLTPSPERRNEPAKGAYPAGRFKMCYDILRSNFSNLSIVNILALMFALPMLAIVAFVAVMGAENFSYILNGIKETPYFMSELGIGLSAGASLASSKAAMLISYRVLFLGIAAGLPLMGIGLAGVYHVTTKMIWGESFICKKDKYGNDIPRMVTEFFRGVKLYWKQSVIIMLVFALVVAGASNLIINFVEGGWLGNLNAWDYIGLIFSCIIGLASAMVLFNLLPMVAAYDLPLLTKLKNATILAGAFFIPTLFILIFAAFPFALLAGGTILKLFGGFVLAIIGFSYFGLVSANYLAYNSEKIIVPLYEATLQSEKKKNKKPKTNKK